MIYRAICCSLLALLLFTGASAQNIFSDPSSPSTRSYADIVPTTCSFNNQAVGRVTATCLFNLESTATVTYFFSAIRQREDSTFYYTPLCGDWFSGTFQLSVSPSFSVGNASVAIFLYIRDSLGYNYSYK